jgi:hypothetical protein
VVLLKLRLHFFNISNKNPKAFWDILNNLNRLKGENSKTEEILPQEDFIKFYQNLNSRDKDHNSVQKQIIEEFVSHLFPFLCNRTKKLSFQIFGKVPFLNIRLKRF